MTTGVFVRRSLAHYWRTNLAVVAGVTVAVSVLGGALLVGDSVRQSLRDIAFARLGRTSLAITGEAPVREALADDLLAHRAFRPTFEAAVGLVAVEGAAVHEPSGRRAGRVMVYGVDDRFFAFHGLEGLVRAPTGRQAIVSAALARDLAAAAGDPLQVRVPKPSAVPPDTVQGRRDDLARTIRLTVEGIAEDRALGEFSIRPRQDAVRAIFVPKVRLQRDLDLEQQVNLVLVSAAPGRRVGPAEVLNFDRTLAETVQLADLGVKLVALDHEHALSLEATAGLLPDALEATARGQARRLGFTTRPVLTYIANSIRISSREREIPYSVVAGGALSTDAPAAPSAIWLSDWAADELAARPGDPVTLDYFVWSDDDGLVTRSSDFVLAGILPMSGAAVDRTLTPEYPGLTDAARMGDWDPPFPVDLRRIRPRDEAYWQQYRTAPKAFVTLGTARALWGSRHGQQTSLRITVPPSTPLESARGAMRLALADVWRPAAAGLVARPVAIQAEEASRGSTDFGQYFVYFSFFLVVAGLLLTALFFKLSVEQRAPEIGLLRAVGFTPGRIRSVLLAESAVLAAVGCALGVAGAVGFSSLILFALGTWWIDAVGTDRIAIAIRPVHLVDAALVGFVVAIVAMAATLRRLGGRSPRALLSGTTLSGPGADTAREIPEGWRRIASLAMRGIVLLLLGGAGLLIWAAWTDRVTQATGFFGAGACLLLASLSAFEAWLRGGTPRSLSRPGPWPVLLLGLRQPAVRPDRSVLSAALVALAVFVIVSVGAFRRGAPDNLSARHSGTGGFTLLAESVAPLLHDPGTRAGREALGLGDLEADLSETPVARFRLRPGDDGSCLNLYRPSAPRVLGVTAGFRRDPRFSFAKVLDGASDEERANPWRLLERRFDDGAVAAIADANSLTYVLHSAVGRSMLLAGRADLPVRVRFVASLADSVFQSEVLVAEERFLRLYPREQGYRVFLLAPPAGKSLAIASALEDRLSDLGFDAEDAGAKLASFHRVENAYLTTFQALGGLGLLVGTLGMGTVLLRNVLERRRELGLLRAVGFERRHLALLVAAETVLLLTVGLGSGVVGALVAIAPAVAERGGQVTLAGTAALVGGVAVVGLLSSIAATRAAARAEPLEALRGE